LILDYGPATTIPTHTLRGIRSHALVSPFGHAGLVDISASVDFTGLADAALSGSEAIEVHGAVPQGHFLRAMGIDARAGALVKAAGGDQEAAKRIKGAVERLVDMGPRGMGGLYQALAVVPVGRAESGGVVGFGGQGTGF
jgi:NADH dehydrogenase [ubiquinone] 1 alpha subcomplex assembly factor 7